MSEIRFLLDEHVDPRLRKAIKSVTSEIVVWRVGDPAAPALRTLDDEILRWCEEQSFSLITNNRASMPGHLQDHLAAGNHVPGIFTLHPKMSYSETAEELALIWGACAAEEFLDQIHYLPLSS